MARLPRRRSLVPCLGLVVAGCLLAACGTSTLPAGTRDGQVHVRPDGQFLVWDAEARRWLETDAWWLSFAGRGPGRTWPKARRLPPPDEVDENDMILLQMDLGNCLMYFAHGRWQRANDVFQWDDEFDHFGGCPHVFDSHVIGDQ